MAEGETTAGERTGKSTSGEKKYSKTSSLLPLQTVQLITPENGSVVSKMMAYDLGVSSPDQMNQKQQEVQQLNKDLLEQRAAMAALHSSLENKDKVRPHSFSNMMSQH